MKARKKKAEMTQRPRVKTDVRLAPELMVEIEGACLKLGLTKNSFFVMATAYMCGVLTPVLGDGKTDVQAMAFLHREIGKILHH